MLSLGVSLLFAFVAVLAILARHILSRNTAWLATTPPRKPRKTNKPLPASWYKSDEIFELEKRAIFSKRWILVTHKLRFPDNGSFVKYEMAGYLFFLIRDNNGNINGFHNVCRHRAFPVVTKDSGKASILSCKYHGWSYGLAGNLAKAPDYQDMKGFDKKKNGLFPLHVRLDARGFIWVNLEAAKVPTMNWSDDVEGIDSLPRHDDVNFDDYKFDHAREMSGNYNWKILAERYNENHHRSTSGAQPNVNKNGLNTVTDSYFPNSSTTLSPYFFYVMRCMPTSSSHCTVEYEVYRHKNASDTEFKKTDDVFKRIFAENESIFSNAEKSITAATNASTRSRIEPVPLYFQSQVYESLEHHKDLEEAAGKPIRPAQQVVTNSVTDQDSELCAGLTCGDDAKKLEW